MPVLLFARLCMATLNHVLPIFFARIFTTNYCPVVSAVDGQLYNLAISADTPLFAALPGDALLISTIVCKLTDASTGDPVTDVTYTLEVV